LTLQKVFNKGKKMGIIEDRNLSKARERAADLIETASALRAQWTTLQPQLLALETELDTLPSIADATIAQVKALSQFRQQKQVLVQQRASYKADLQTFLAMVQNAGYEAEIQAEIDLL